MPAVSKKICLIGDFGVGKTSLIQRYVERQFSDQYLSTVGVKISRKTIDMAGAIAVPLQLLIWDIEGSTRFRGISASYLQGASGAVIVADVTARETVEQTAEHIQQFIKVNPRGIILIALNKADLLSPKAIDSLMQIQRQICSPFCGSSIPIYRTSAKTGEQVDHIFQTLAQALSVSN